jgi:transposase
MSLHAHAVYQVPEETQRVARAAFPNGNPYMQVTDTLGTIYQDEQFAALFPTRGQPAEAPARLALVTVLQFAEGFSDRRAADAVRGRIDWKYVLGLELTLQRHLVIDNIVVTRYSASGARTTDEEAEDVTSLSDGT